MKRTNKLSHSLGLWLPIFQRALRRAIEYLEQLARSEDVAGEKPSAAVHRWRAEAKRYRIVLAAITDKRRAR